MNLNINCGPLGMKKAEFWNRLTIKSSWHISDSKPDGLLLPSNKFYMVWTNLWFQTNKYT